MGYVEQNLMQGEQIRYHTKLHWIVFASPILLVVVGLAFVMLAASGIAVLFFLVGTLLGVSRLIAYQSSEFAVTNRRVLIKVGFIRRHSVELLLQKVEGIGVDQGIFGRMLAYGTIIVTGTGGTKEPFKNIENPLGFRKEVQESLSQ